MEQGPHPGRVHRRLAQPGFSGPAQHHQGVHRAHLSVRPDQERIKVHLADLILLHGQTGKPHQGVHQGVPVGGGLAPEGVQQAVGFHLQDHVPGLGAAQGGQAEDHIPQGLGENPAQAEHDHRSELGVIEQPGHKLPAARQHGLDQKTFQIPPGLGGHAGSGVMHLAFGVQVQGNQPPFGLVGETCAQCLQHHRKPHLPRGRDGLGRAGCDTFPHHRHPILGKQQFGIRLVQRFVPTFNCSGYNLFRFHFSSRSWDQAGALCAPLQRREGPQT